MHESQFSVVDLEMWKGGFSHWRMKCKIWGCHAHFQSHECIHDTHNYCLVAS